MGGWVEGRKEGNKLCTLSTLRINSDVCKACDTASVQSTAIFIPFQIQKAAILVMEWFFFYLKVVILCYVAFIFNT